MPTKGKAWRHIVISTYGSWLPGDPRGFRAEDHKIHSSGDYKKLPPEGEHEGLHRFSREISGEPVILPDELLEIIGKRIGEKLKEHGHRVLALSVSSTHSHWLVELPDSMPEIRKIVGQCKTASSHAVRGMLARYGSFKRIDDPEYQRNVFRYILNQADAWIWSYKDDEEIIDSEA